jgi:hypothetical protein
MGSRMASSMIVTTLLEHAGAHPPRYGRKWDCPKCGGHSCLSVDEARGLFNCFHAGCDFHGNAEMLARRLGLASRLPLEEYRELQERRCRASLAAARLYRAVKARRFELLAELRALGRLEYLAHDAGMDHPATWNALARVYADMPGIEAGLLALETAKASDVLSLLTNSANVRDNLNREE